MYIRDKPLLSKSDKGRKASVESESVESEDEVFEVEEIRNFKLVGKRRTYEIKWKGYPSSENTWEEESQINVNKFLLY